MADFTTLHVTDAIANASVARTLTNGVEYTLPAGVAAGDCYAMCVNSHITGRGKTSGGGNQNLADVTFFMDDSAIETSILVQRAGSAGDCAFTLLIKCWTGDDDSPLRMTVVHREVVSDNFLTGGVFDPSSNFTVTDASRCLPLIAAQQSEQEGRTAQHEAFFTADALNQVSGTTYNVTMRRGAGNGSRACRVSIAILQFGPGWDPIRRIEFNSADAYDPTVTPGTAFTAWDTTTTTSYGILDITQATFPDSGLTAGFTPFRNILETLLHSQYRIAGAAPQGNDDAYVMVEVDAGRLTDSAHADHSASPKTHLIVRARNRVDSTNKFNVVWVLSPGLGARGMAVQHLTRYFDNNLGGGEEEIDNSNDTPHPWSPLYAGVSSATNAAAWTPQVNSDGTGAGVPRGYTDFQLPDPAGGSDVLRMVRSESGQEERQYVQVVEWPSWSGWRGTLRAWEQRRSGLMEWDQPPGLLATEQRRSGMTTGEAIIPRLQAWEQRRSGLTEWEQ